MWLRSNGVLVPCPRNSSNKFAWGGRPPGLRPTPSSACLERHGRAGPGGPAQTRASAPQDLLHEPLGQETRGAATMSESLPRVVIVGGGFGGLAAARALKNTPA